MMRNIFKKCLGFTLVEMVLVIMLIGIIFGVASTILLRAIDSYQFVTERTEVIERARFCLDRMTREFQLLGAGDITVINATSIQFTDSQNFNTDFTLNGNVLQRGNDVLCNNIMALNFTYFNATGGTAGSANQVRRIRIDITAQGGGTAGATQLRSEAAMRGMMYDNYL
jgi:prepilin-type N-terminal cleavage/methylation domain-containing protein